MNLLILLLVAAPLHRQAEDPRDVRRTPSATDEAFERMFERDKDDLRALGVPSRSAASTRSSTTSRAIASGPTSSRSPRSTSRPTRPPCSAWPPGCGSTPAWPRHQRRAGQAQRRRRGGRPQPARHRRARGDRRRPALRRLLGRLPGARPVRFDYQRSGAGEPATRHPAAVGRGAFSGRWYVVGRDVDRGEERIFRLSRVPARSVASARPAPTWSRRAPTCAS